jgi:hypothetical protein
MLTAVAARRGTPESVVDDRADHERDRSGNQGGGLSDFLRLDSTPRETISGKDPTLNRTKRIPDKKCLDRAVHLLYQTGLLASFISV